MSTATLLKAPWELGNTGLVLPKKQISWIKHEHVGIIISPFSVEHFGVPAPPNPTWGTPLLDFGTQMLTIVNDWRASKGVGPLRFDDRLLASSMWKSMNMSGYQYMQHDDPPNAYPPNGRTFAQRIYSYYPTSAATGENICYGFPTPQDAFNAFISAGPGEGHYENLISSQWVGCGFSAALASNGLVFCTQDFGTDAIDVPPDPSDTTPPTVPTNLRSVNITNNQISIAWDASTDAGTGVKAYGIYNGVNYYGDVTQIAATINGLVPSTTYLFGVDAVDYNGNRSKQVQKAMKTTGTTPPPPPPPPTTPEPAKNQIWTNPNNVKHIITSVALSKVSHRPVNKPNATPTVTPENTFKSRFTYVSG